jgi:hypothetical protein
LQTWYIQSLYEDIDEVLARGMKKEMGCGRCEVEGLVIQGLRWTDVYGV